MTAVLRIALTYFQLLPLQRWLNLAGLLLLAVAAGILAFGDTMATGKSVFIACLFGIMLIVIVPGFGGGIAMRMASRPTIAHLRPHGRLILFAGATLAMSLLVLLITLPSLAGSWYVALNNLQPANRFGEPLEFAVLMWPVVALGWIIMFAASRTLLLAVVFPLIPLSALKMPALFDAFPALEGWHVVAFGVVAWMAFGIWYLLTKRIAPPSGHHASVAMAGTSSPAFIWMLDRKESDADTASPAIATFHYLLGSGSYRVFLVSGAWTAAIFIAVSFFTPQNKTGPSALLLFMVPFLSFQCAVTGFTTARRARLLWLRTGVDRSGLFRLAESLGLRASMAGWGVVAGAVLAVLLATDPASAGKSLLFVGAQSVVALCMYYAGLAIVRNWEASDVILCITFLLLLLVQMVLANPGGGIPRLQALITLLTAAVLLLPLRWYAQRRWHRLDWRLIKPTAGWQRGGA
jgi:hypothetical protein